VAGGGPAGTSEPQNLRDLSRVSNSGTRFESGE
jgi:hypothetical protein